jgi:protease I
MTLSTQPLEGLKVAVVIADGFQDEEGVETPRFLTERGMEVTYLGPAPGIVRGKHGREEAEVTGTVADADPAGFDLLYLPGGAAPEVLRLDDSVLAFTRAFIETGKPVAAICHGAQILISARVLAGRTLTCVAGIRDDVEFAGGRYVDKAVVIDDNLVTSRMPADLPAFNEALAELLATPATG